MKKLMLFASLLITASACSSLFEVTEHSRADDFYKKEVKYAASEDYFEESSTEPKEIAEYYNEDGEIEYFDPNYNYTEPFNSPFQSNNSFNPYNPYSSSMWLSPSIAYWNRQASFGMGLGYGSGIGMGYGGNPYYSSWYSPAWNPYSSNLYNPWYYQPNYGFGQPSMYNPYYNQWMNPWGNDRDRSPVYYQKRNNSNRRYENSNYVPGRNVVPLQNTKKRQAVPRNASPAPTNNRTPNSIKIESPRNVQPSNRGTSPNNTNRYKSPNRTTSPSRINTAPASRPSPSFSSPSPSISPSRSSPRSSPSRSSSPNRR